MKTKFITLLLASLIAAGISGYFFVRDTSKEKSVASNVLFAIGDQSVTIPEFEEFLQVAQEKSGTVSIERPQRYYYMLWEHAAIHAWNKKHKIDQLPEYKKEAKKSEEWLKQHPQEIITDRKDIIANRIQCMILIECWWRDLDNHFFLLNFPLFKPYIDTLSFDKFGALSGQMILDLHNELKTYENSQYLKRNNIKGIDALIHDIKHPELQPVKYEYAVTNSIFFNTHILVYGKDSAVLSEISIPAAQRISETSSSATNAHDIPINFANDDQKKAGVQKVVIQALDNQGKILQETELQVQQKYQHGNFQIFISEPRHAPANKKQGNLFYAFI